MRKFISYTLIALGLVLILYPTILDKYHMHQQNQILKQFETMEVSENEESPVNTEKSNEDAVKAESAIKIDKIGLYQAILNKTTKENLNVSITTMTDIKPGEVGNYVLAGHRSFTYGRDFNRLNELEKGDEVIIITKGKQFKYVIEDKFLVNPNETWVADSKSDFPEITLITCDPMVEATHRLILKAKLVEN